MKAIILAGGLGTRLRPLTDTTPKPLLPVAGIPIIEHALKNFLRHGITDVVLSVGYQADKIKDYFGDGGAWGMHITYSVEDQPLGTGGALKRAAAGVGETLLAINGDNLADFDWTSALASHSRNNADITLALYPVEDVTHYGIARLEGEKIVEFVEKPAADKAPSNLNNAGGYIFEPSALDILPNGVSSIEKDCFEKLGSEGAVFAFLHQGQWFPTDTPDAYRRAQDEFKPFDES